MTFETPSHAVRFCVINDRHVVYGTVAAKTTNAAIHMRAVIIKNVIGRAMDLHPLNGVASLPTHTYRLELRIVLLHLRMAVHACLRSGQIRVGSHIDKTVTVTAIHS